MPPPSWIDAVNRWSLDLRGAILLFGKGQDVNARDNSSIFAFRGMTALHFAARSRKTTIVGILLGLGADVNARDKSGKTALHHAADGWWINDIESADETLCLLLKRGADIKIRGHRHYADYNTALHFAVYSEDAAAIRVLQQHGADLNAKNVNGQSALDMAGEDLRNVIAQIRIAAPVRAPDDGG